MLHNLAR